mmetsp:Transcript_69793/g.115914  ORF Transcript_69793/g.115914 Transcript_69793/m.115914 type:complete len:256 (-) Transcript_69793:743-1510(-)
MQEWKTSDCRMSCSIGTCDLQKVIECAVCVRSMQSNVTHGLELLYTRRFGLAARSSMRARQWLERRCRLQSSRRETSTTSIPAPTLTPMQMTMLMPMLSRRQPTTIATMMMTAITRQEVKSMAEVLTTAMNEAMWTYRSTRDCCGPVAECNKRAWIARMTTAQTVPTKQTQTESQTQTVQLKLMTTTAVTTATTTTTTTITTTLTTTATTTTTPWRRKRAALSLSVLYMVLRHTEMVHAETVRAETVQEMMQGSL